MKDYQNLIGLLAIAVAIYLGMTDRVQVNTIEQTELQTCMDITTRYTNKSGFEAYQICMLAYSRS